MDHSEHNLPVAADAENQSVIQRLDYRYPRPKWDCPPIESTPEQKPGPISREYAKQIRRDLLNNHGNPSGIKVTTAAQVRSFEQEEEARGYRLDHLLTADDRRLAESVRLDLIKDAVPLEPETVETARRQLEAEQARINADDGIVSAAAARLAETLKPVDHSGNIETVLPRLMSERDRAARRRIVEAGIAEGIRWQFRAYGGGEDEWGPPCSATGPRPLWLPMIEYRLYPPDVDRRIAQTWTDYATRGLDEPYCVPTPRDWVSELLALLAGVLSGGALVWLLSRVY